jgi:hypothetical protein
LGVFNIQVGFTSGTASPLVEIPALVFPNPASTVLNVRFLLNQMQPVRLEVFGTGGQLIYSTPVEMLPAGQHEWHIPVADLPEGAYILDIQAGAGRRNMPFQVVR